METILKEKFYASLEENNPDVIVSARSQEGGITKYIEELFEAKRPAIDAILNSGHQPNEIQEEILSELLSELVPSRFHYVLELLKNNYKEKYEEFSQLGLVKTLAINLVEFCGKIFENYQFSNMTEDSAWLQFEILAAMENYFEVEE